MILQQTIEEELKKNGSIVIEGSPEEVEEKEAVVVVQAKELFKQAHGRQKLVLGYTIKGISVVLNAIAWILTAPLLILGWILKERNRKK